jgi:hypothetical protein
MAVSERSTILVQEMQYDAGLDEKNWWSLYSIALLYVAIGLMLPDAAV